MHPFLLFALAATPAASPLLDTLPTLHVVGVGRVTAAPDKVDLFLTVHTDEASTEAAMRENDSRLSAAMAVAKDLGIAANDVQLSAVSLSSREDYDPGTNRPRGTRFMVDKQLVVCLRTPPKLDTLLIQLSKTKVLVSRIDFASEAVRAAQAQLPAKAMLNARERAESMAAVVGAKVGRALKINSAPENEGTRGFESYSTGGGVSVGGAATGALTSSTSIAVDFELLPKP